MATSHGTELKTHPWNTINTLNSKLISDTGTPCHFNTMQQSTSWLQYITIIMLHPLVHSIKHCPSSICCMYGITKPALMCVPPNALQNQQKSPMEKCQISARVAPLYVHPAKVKY